MTAGQSVKIATGSVVTGALAFLAANFTLSAKTTLGAGIIALVGYVIGAIVHKPSTT